MLVANTNNHALRKVGRCVAVSTLAGGINGQGYADRIGAASRFNRPWSIEVDAQGSIFVANSDNNCLRQVAPSDGAVSTLAGNREEEKDFADGQAAASRFDTPLGMALDMDGHLIIANFENNCIRKVTTAEGHVTTVAGSAFAEKGFADGAASTARYNGPLGITVDCNNNI